MAEVAVGRAGACCDREDSARWIGSEADLGGPSLATSEGSYKTVEPAGWKWIGRGVLEGSEVRHVGTPPTTMPDDVRGRGKGKQDEY